MNFVVNVYMMKKRIQCNPFFRAYFNDKCKVYARSEQGLCDRIGVKGCSIAIRNHKVRCNEHEQDIDHR